VNAVPRWRIAAAIGILAALVLLLALLAPAYFHNLDLQSYVSALTRSEAGRATPDGSLRQQIVEKATELHVPVTADNVRIERSADGKLKHIDVRYFVEVDVPGYTVKLHFYPGAASQ
jgi:hypothetical protein